MRKRDRNSSELRVPPAIRRTRDIPPSVHGVHGRPSESHLATPQISTRSGLVASVAEGEGEGVDDDVDGDAREVPLHPQKE